MATCFTLAGRSFSGTGQNVGLAFVKLKDWDLRSAADLKVDSLLKRAMGKFSKIRNARVFAFPPPAVMELGQSGGFDFQLQDRGGVGHEALMAARNQLLGRAAQDPRLIRVRPNGLEDVSQYRIDVDWKKAGALGVPIDSIHTTISAAFGGAYVNGFIQGGRVKRVYVQADAPYRMLPKDLDRLYVRNDSGTMTPFASFATGHWFQGSPRLERFNSFPSLNIWAGPPPGKSSGEAMQAMEEIASQLPRGLGFDWTGLSYQERMAKSQAPLLYAFSIIVIFLCLAALYESWTVPISILLTLPLGVVGGVAASSLRGFFNDVYFETGLKNNRDRRVAALNVDRARALCHIQAAEILPTVDATGRLVDERVPGTINGNGRSVTLKQYRAEVGITSWEIDFFGRIRRLAHGTCDCEL